MTDLHEGSKQKLSTLAMLVDCLIKYEGLSTTRELAERTGRHPSQIRKARAEIASGQICSPPLIFERSNVSDSAQICSPEEVGTLPAFNMESTNVDTSYEDKKVESPFYSPTGFESRVKMEKGTIVLCEDLRRFWLEDFGTDRDLDLALTQAAGYVQPHGSRPLEAQVAAQLAKYAREKRDRDRRYQAACKSNAPAPKKSILDCFPIATETAQ